MKEWLVNNIVAWKKMPFGVKLSLSFLASLWLLVMVLDFKNWLFMSIIAGVCWAMGRITKYWIEGK